MTNKARDGVRVLCDYPTNKNTETGGFTKIL